ncbi:MAG: YaiI/YqxD family protein [Candidatus Binatia bacterium]
MHIWVDADACPAVVKEILFRAAARVGCTMTLVANRLLRTPDSSPGITSVRVADGADVADRHIVASLAAGDLVITADIPLAADSVEAGAFALNPRGELYTRDNVRQALAARDLLTELRSDGLVSGGPAPIGQADRQRFANALDRFLTERLPR